jgi:hypothetical protein
MENIYMQEKSNKRIYDGVREYCMVEQVNEEYFRASMGQKGWKHKPAIIKIIMDILQIW